ncbi:hypothetical protein AN958_05952 [Leucoagaricus sp. SymC.cos]|nr:hypothetical protein AN958_05952 [Leucoagaricus sp. SymC.cos]
MVKDVNLIAASLAACIAIIVDFAWCFREERVYIWRAPITFIKAAYVYARYFPIVPLVAHFCLLFRFVFPFPEELCKNWFLFLHNCALAVQFTLELVSYLRVYALYQRGWKMGILVISMFIVGAVVGVFGGLYLYLWAKFDTRCSCKPPDRVSLVMPIVFQGTQGIVWGLMWYQRRVISRRVDSKTIRSNIPLLPILFRDTSLVVAILSIGFALTVPYSMVIKINTLTIYPCSLTFLSIVNCHLVLNMLQSRRPTATPDVGTIELDLTFLHEETIHEQPREGLKTKFSSSIEVTASRTRTSPIFSISGFDLPPGDSMALEGVDTRTPSTNSE